MKQTFAFASLVSICIGLVHCGPGDSDPPPVTTDGTGGPPVAQGGANGSANAAGGADSAVPLSGVTPIGEGQAGAPLDPGMEGPGAGGAAGMNAGGAAGAPPGELTLEELVGALDGHLFTVACGDTPNTDDCAGEGWRSSFVNNGALNICVGGRLEALINFPIGGEAGVRYDVDMHFYGIMEPRNYGNVATREAQGRPSTAPGGTPTPFASMVAGAGNYLSTGDNNYNTYELHVLDNNNQEVAIHFLNADTQTGHYTFGIDYGKTIELIGGGVLRLQIADANCRQIKNCGPGGIPCQGKTQEIDISAADPQPPANALQQPGLGKDPEHSGQWFLLDVLAFTPAQ